VKQTKGRASGTVVLSQMEEVLDLLKPLSSYLVAIANPSKTVPPEKMWYLPPEQHVAEIIFFNIVFGVGLICTDLFVLIHPSLTPYPVTLKSGRTIKDSGN
jgi:hypothetical protein